MKYVVLISIILIALGVVWIKFFQTQDQLTIINMDNATACVQVSGMDSEISVVSQSAYSLSFTPPSEGAIEWRYCENNAPSEQIAYISNYVTYEHFIVILDGNAQYFSSRLQ